MYQLYGNDLWIYSNVCTYVHFEWERAPVVCVCVTAQTDQPGISALFFFISLQSPLFLSCLYVYEVSSYEPLDELENFARVEILSARCCTSSLRFTPDVHSLPFTEFVRGCDRKFMRLICSFELAIKRLSELLRSHKREKEPKWNQIWASAPEEQKYRSKSHQCLNANYQRELNCKTSFGLAMLILFVLLNHHWTEFQLSLCWFWVSPAWEDEAVSISDL